MVVHSLTIIAARAVYDLGLEYSLETLVAECIELVDFFKAHEGREDKAIFEAARIGNEPLCRWYLDVIGDSFMFHKAACGAAKGGHHDLMLKMYEEDTSKEDKPIDRAALISALQGGHLWIFRKYLEYAEVNLQTVNTWIAEAAMSGSLEVCQYMWDLTSPDVSEIHTALETVVKLGHWHLIGFFNERMPLDTSLGYHAIELVSAALLAPRPEYERYRLAKHYFSLAKQNVSTIRVYSDNRLFRTVCETHTDWLFQEFITEVPTYQARGVFIDGIKGALKGGHQDYIDYLLHRVEQTLNLYEWNVICYTCCKSPHVEITVPFLNIRPDASNFMEVMNKSVAYGNLELIKALAAMPDKAIAISGIAKAISLNRYEVLKTLLKETGDIEDTWLKVFEHRNIRYHARLKFLKTPEGQTWEARLWYARLFDLPMLERISKRKIDFGQV